MALSSLDVITAWTNFSVSAIDKRSLILLMFPSWKKQALQLRMTCLSSIMCISKMAPMFLAEGDGSIRFPNTSMHYITGVDGVVHSRSVAKIWEFVREYLRPLLGSKNTVKFSMKNISPYLHSASLVVLLLTLSLSHYSELSISRFPTPCVLLGAWALTVL